jgi:hypothetical protein
MKITTVDQTAVTAGIAVDGIEVGYVWLRTGKFTFYKTHPPILTNYAAVSEAIDDHVALLMVATRLTS